MVEHKKRGPYYLITGLVIGLIIGLFYAWVMNPTRYVDITPKSLHADYQKLYLQMIAESYQANEDMGRSYSRIKQMMDPVNLDTLRSMLLEMESDPDFKESFDVIRNFINDLDIYIRNQNNWQAENHQNPVIEMSPVENFEFENQTKPTAETLRVIAPESSGGSQQSDGFYVISNP
ncbi:hypothetical protein [Flexilinea flocculi]|jgi:hypothetical protein|uniref:Uncharacterized protein n=1 Tax=Flexilinea flocculi TaxID=1678840 RepID=A0A0K8P9Q3_9CHLR|nr:hypothetical protein [Flexilinea flocculi]NMB92736.1 hypothetical protein [Flexilinea flocculi]GAP39229.1 hypothetical protein ATC1_11151 [Flexilinea flocculi]